MPEKRNLSGNITSFIVQNSLAVGIVVVVLFLFIPLTKFVRSSKTRIVHIFSQKMLIILQISLIWMKIMQISKKNSKNMMK